MRRRSDAVDVLLEEWAEWRYLMTDMEFSTGGSSIVHFGRTYCAGGIPLWRGTRTNRRILALDHDLTVELEPLPVSRLVVFYGMAGPIDRKARAMNITVNHLKTLSQKARTIALSHVPKERSKRFYRDSFRNRSKKSDDLARPLQPVPAPD